MVEGRDVAGLISLTVLLSGVWPWITRSNEHCAFVNSRHKLVLTKVGRAPTGLNFADDTSWDTDLWVGTRTRYGLQNGGGLFMPDAKTIYSSKPLCNSIYFAKIVWTCCHLVPTLKVTKFVLNKIRHKLRQYSIKVVGDNQLKTKICLIHSSLHSSRDKNAF